MEEVSYDKVIVEIVDYAYGGNVESLHARSCAKLALLDALGCAMESLRNPEAQKIIGPLLQGASMPPGFRLPGTHQELDPIKGAFDMGTLIRFLDHNDAFQGAERDHPSGMLV